MFTSPAFTALPPEEQKQRAAAVEAARTWIGTPYAHMARVKGPNGGVDCSMILAEVYEECGLIPHLDIGFYPPDWHLHRNDERYLDEMLNHAVEVFRDPLPGDIVLWRFGRTFSHGAIVSEWPVVIHAYLRVGVVLENVEQAQWLKFIGENTADRGKLRPMRVFTWKGWV